MKALELLEKQHATLDRVVQAKFDVPMRVTTPHPQSAPVFPNYMLTDVLSVDDDAEFMEKVSN
jgi:hypothetical protein